MMSIGTTGPPVSHQLKHALDLMSSELMQSEVKHTKAEWSDNVE
jgi:hypothetical protein